MREGNARARTYTHTRRSCAPREVTAACRTHANTRTHTRTRIRRAVYRFTCGPPPVRRVAATSPVDGFSRSGVEARSSSPSARMHTGDFLRVRRDVTLHRDGGGLWERRRGAAGRRRRRTTERGSRGTAENPRENWRPGRDAGRPGARDARRLLTIFRGESAAAGALARRHGTDVTRPRLTHASHSKSPTPSRALDIPPKLHNKHGGRRHRRRALAASSAAPLASRGRRRGPRRPCAFIPAGATRRTACDAALPPGRRSPPRRIAVSIPGVHPVRRDTHRLPFPARLLRSAYRATPPSSGSEVECLELEAPAPLAVVRHFQATYDRAFGSAAFARFIDIN